MKIWIGGKLGVRDWIDVVLAVNSLTIMCATLPLPDILAGSELAETNQQTDIDGGGDKRCKFFTNGQSKDVTSMTDETTGYLSEKWSNLKDDGTTASNTANDGVETDYPLFRLADVYLMYAECVARTQGASWDPWPEGKSDASDPEVIASRKQGAIYWINLLRERAGNTDVWANNFANDDEFLQFILDERARELYHEGYRRTDLIRFGEFTTSKYICSEADACR